MWLVLPIDELNLRPPGEALVQWNRLCYLLSLQLDISECVHTHWLLPTDRDGRQRSVCIPLPRDVSGTPIKSAIHRHDNDRELPRTLNEIYELNRAMVRRMNEIFTDRGIPVVPSLGALLVSCMRDVLLSPDLTLTTKPWFLSRHSPRQGRYLLFMTSNVEVTLENLCCPFDTL